MSVINMFPFSTKEVLQRCPALSFQNYRTGLLSHLEKEQAGVLKVDFISSKKKKSEFLVWSFIHLTVY